MELPIKKNSLSVGFGRNHDQTFFDTLKSYDDYILDYFLSMQYNIGGEKWNSREESLIERMDTYHYPANLLFNQPYGKEQIYETIDRIKNIINLKSVTILDPSLADTIKQYIPGIKIHLSVRFWDWGRFKCPKTRLYEVRDMGIDVVNVSGKHQYNDFEFFDTIHELGMQTKFIVDEDCVVGSDINYSEFPGFDDYMCRPNPFHSRSCWKGCMAVQNEYPWLILGSNCIYKESLQYYPEIDILKISTRPRLIDYVQYQLNYWTGDSPTLRIITHFGWLDISKHYDAFLDYVEFKALHCRGDCFKCQKCKYFYDEFTNGGEDLGINK